MQSKKVRAEYEAEFVAWETQLHTSHEIPLENRDEEKKKMEYYTDPAKQAAINKELRKRQDLMFVSTYRADPSSTSFLDLPLEIRNRIYTLSMFHHLEGEPHFKLIVDKQKDVFVPWFRAVPHKPSFGCSLAISIFEMLGAMNKQIREEVRREFYREAVMSLQGEWPDGGDYHSMVQRFLDGAGKEDRASLPKLDIMYLDQAVLDFGVIGYASFQSVVNSLSFCKNLSSLALQLGVSHILHADHEGLEKYFLHNRPLLSPGLEHFVSIMTSLPKLKRLDLTFKTTGHIPSSPLAAW
jgi:hypothetical protein